MAEPFRHRLRVRWGECDVQGVVYYVNYAEYVDLAITELWRERIRPYGEMMAAGDDLVVAELQLRYRASAKFDDLVDIVLEVERLGETSMTTAWRIERSGEVLCDGTIRHVFIDPRTFAKAPIPDDVRAALA
jgi:acyl-CoA thioester hydrolase